MKYPLAAVVCLFQLCFAADFAHACPQLAQEDEGGALGLADLSIEELMALHVPSMQGVLGGHVHNKGEWMPMY